MSKNKIERPRVVIDIEDLREVIVQADAKKDAGSKGMTGANGATGTSPLHTVPSTIMCPW